MAASACRMSDDLPYRRGEIRKTFCAAARSPTSRSQLVDAVDERRRRHDFAVDERILHYVEQCNGYASERNRLRAQVWLGIRLRLRGLGRSPQFSDLRSQFLVIPLRQLEDDPPPRQLGQRWRQDRRPRARPAPPSRSWPPRGGSGGRRRTRPRSRPSGTCSRRCTPSRVGRRGIERVDPPASPAGPTRSVPGGSIGCVRNTPAHAAAGDDRQRRVAVEHVAERHDATGRADRPPTTSSKSPASPKIRGSIVSNRSR